MTKSVTFNHMVEFMEKGKIVYGHLNVCDFTWAPLPREQIKNITYKPAIVYTTKRPYLDEMKFMFTHNQHCCLFI